MPPPKFESIAKSTCRRLRQTSLSTASVHKTTSRESHNFINTPPLPRLGHADCRRPMTSYLSKGSHYQYFHSTSTKFTDTPPPTAPKDDTSPPYTPASSPKVEELFQKIIYLDMVEVHLLTELINQKLGLKISAAEEERMTARFGGGRAGKLSEEDDNDAAKQKEVEPEKTTFDLKLTGFDAKAKIKVIKEIRTITALGLKEAKELVEGVPAMVKKQIKKEEAEELKKKLEEVGAQVEIS